MSWYTAMNDKGRIFPIFVESNTIQIPNTDVNSKFTIDNDKWIITETFPNVENDIVTWQTREWAQLVTFEPMKCFADVNRIIYRRNGYIGKTIVINGEEYLLKTLLRNDHVEGIFDAQKSDRLYIQIRISGDLKDDVYIAENKEWVKKDYEWKVLLNGCHLG